MHKGDNDTFVFDGALSRLGSNVPRMRALWVVSQFTLIVVIFVISILVTRAVRTGEKQLQVSCEGQFRISTVAMDYSKLGPTCRSLFTEDELRH